MEALKAFHRRVRQCPGLAAVEQNRLDDGFVEHHKHLCGITIKGKWERDALLPGIRLFLESHPQKVVDLGSGFGLVGLQPKHPGLTAILVPDSNTTEGRIPSIPPLGLTLTTRYAASECFLYLTSPRPPRGVNFFYPTLNLCTIPLLNAQLSPNDRRCR